MQSEPGRKTIRSRGNSYAVCQGESPCLWLAALIDDVMERS